MTADLIRNSMNIAENRVKLFEKMQLYEKYTFEYGSESDNFSLI